MGSLGVTEILIILAIVLLLFGGKKIPELMKGLGSGIKEFKNAAKEEENKESETHLKYFIYLFIHSLFILIIFYFLFSTYIESVTIS